MSYEIAVWRGKNKSNKEQAAIIYEKLLNGNKEDVVPFEGIEYFLQELAKECPLWDELTEEQKQTGPWEAAFDTSDSHVILHLRNEHCFNMVPIVLKIATKSDLTYYDPKAQVVYNPNIFSKWFNKMKKVDVMP